MSFRRFFNNCRLIPSNQTDFSRIKRTGRVIRAETSFYFSMCFQTCENKPGQELLR